jgi:hypothetical protein
MFHSESSIERSDSFNHYDLEIQISNSKWGWRRTRSLCRVVLLLRAPTRWLSNTQLAIPEFVIGCHLEFLCKSSIYTQTTHLQCLVPYNTYLLHQSHNLTSSAAGSSIPVGHSAILLFPANLTIFSLYGCASPSKAFNRASLSSLSRFFGNIPLTAFLSTCAPPSFFISSSIVTDFKLPGRVLWR